jgi:hypothetical protein
LSKTSSKFWHFFAKFSKFFLVPAKPADYPHFCRPNRPLTNLTT